MALPDTGRENLMDQEDSAETFDFTDLGEKLRSPNGPSIAAASLARIAQLKDEVAARRAAGLSPGEYERHSALLDALAAAESVVVRISSIMTSVPGTTTDSSPKTKGE
jgi:hypothetical protein